MLDTDDDDELDDESELGEITTHKCLICGKRYAKELSLYAHITSHSQDIQKNLQNKLNYVVDEKISKTRLYSCKSCDFSTSVLKTIKLHGRSHSISTNKENRSPEEYSISTRLGYNNSKLKNFSEMGGDDEFKCGVCDESFSSKQELNWHMKSKHKNHDRDEKSSNETFECDFCKKSFTSKKYISLHLKTHSIGTQKRKGRPRKSEEMIETKMILDDTHKLTKRKRVRHEKPFKCDEENCQYATSQYSLLKAHKFKHNPFYKCVTCQEKFSTRLELKNHMTSHGERPYKCDQCNKCYKDKHGLGWHKKVQHDPSRLKYTCELCGKTYPFDSLLTQHINLTHATEKQSVCDICGKNVSKTYLPMHRRTHGEKQYSCDICEKTFLEKAYLKRHKMVHTGEKPYVCSVCGNSFRQHSTLTIHMRTHTGDRPYKCVLCENAYKTHHNLKKHYKRSGHKLV